jgi:hypothetical protein
MATSRTKLPKRAIPDFLELASVEQQIQKWTAEAVELGRSLEAFGVALREDACQIDFRGDLIVLAHDPKASELQLATVDLARIRNLAFNLRMLKDRRRQLENPSDLMAV